MAKTKAIVKQEVPDPRPTLTDKQRLKKFKTTKKFVFSGITVLYGERRNQVLLKLHTYPDKRIRDELVRCGFRWSRQDMAWYKECIASTLNWLTKMRTQNSITSPLFKPAEGD